MKPHRILSFSFVSAAVVVIVAVIGSSAARRVRADTGCSVGSINGSYGYAHTGFFYTPQGLNLFSAAGLVTADGNGNVTGTDTVSQNGTVARSRTYTGTYQVAPNCTGSIAFKMGDQVIGSMDFVLVNNGKSIKFIQSDQGTAITGTADLQFPGN